MLHSVVAAIRDQQLANVAAIGAELGAGTNCGACRPASPARPHVIG